MQGKIIKGLKGGEKEVSTDQRQWLIKGTCSFDSMTVLHTTLSNHCRYPFNTELNSLDFVEALPSALTFLAILGACAPLHINELHCSCVLRAAFVSDVRTVCPEVRLLQAM